MWVVALDKSAEMSGELNGGRNAIGDRPTPEVYQSSETSISGSSHTDEFSPSKIGHIRLKIKEPAA